MIRFVLGLLFGRALSAMLVFFPFPKGKLYSYLLFPVVLILAFLIEKYTTCTTILPLTLIQSMRRKASFVQCVCLFSGMYCGAAFVTEEIRYAIRTAPDSDKEHMTIFMEKLYLSLN